MGDQSQTFDAGSWLMLLHQIPAKPEALRVRAWRRLQKLGAIQLKNSVYLLPDCGRHRDDLERLAYEIREGGGEAFLFATSWIDGVAEDELVSRYEHALAAEGAPLIKEARTWASKLSRRKNSDDLMDALHVYGKLVSRLKEFRRRDQFRSKTVTAIEAATTHLAMMLFGTTPQRQHNPETLDRTSSWVWITRQRPGVDRLSSAWLIRRFIDKEADIRFFDMDHYQHQKDHLRFDVFGGEFTHEGDLCTFEVLLVRFGIKQPALQLLGEIIHDLDFEDEKFQRRETDEVRSLLRESMEKDDDQTCLVLACNRLDRWLARQT